MRMTSMFSPIANHLLDLAVQDVLDLHAGGAGTAEMKHRLAQRIAEIHALGFSEVHDTAVREDIYAVMQQHEIPEAVTDFFDQSIGLYKTLEKGGLTTKSDEPKADPRRVQNALEQLFDLDFLTSLGLVTARGEHKVLVELNSEEADKIADALESHLARLADKPKLDDVALVRDTQALSAEAARQQRSEASIQLDG